MADWKGERQDTLEYNPVAAEHLHRYAFTYSIIKEKTVLDIACGEGYGSNLMASLASRVVGVDISETVIDHARKKYNTKPNLSYLKGSLEKIPLPDHSIDVVVSFESIEHSTEHDAILSEIKRVLTPGGILIMSTPDKYQYTDITGYKNPFHLKEMYVNEFKQLLDDYFKNTSFFSQRFYSGSLIIPFNQKAREFKMFKGDFNKLDECNAVLDHLYIIAIASDANYSFDNASFFDFTKILQEAHQNYTHKILNSHSYRLGNFFVRKFSFLKRIVRQ